MNVQRQNMASETTFADAVSSFTAASEEALQALPELSALLPGENSNSLLDAKNGILLSYLQALALHNLNAVRSIKDGGSILRVQLLNNEITRQLVEHRIYLERGVRPLEQKIKYPLDKVVKVADDDARITAQKHTSAITSNGNGRTDRRDISVKHSKEDTVGGETSDASSGAAVDELVYRPNTASFARFKPEDSSATWHAKGKRDGVYRPPRISATAMPTTETHERKERKPGSSATVDEYINSELSTVPLIEPSIGSTIMANGRRTRNARQLAEEADRREYEETNLVRLPKEGKKELSRKQGRAGSGFGGEEWQDLGESADRIGDLTKRRGKASTLERSRNKRAIEDGPRNSGIGDVFEVKKRRLIKKMER